MASTTPGRREKEDTVLTGDPVPLAATTVHSAPRRRRLLVWPFTAVACMAALAQISVGIAWWVDNLRAIPAYGDTLEYLYLSRVMRVDTVRTIFYPAVVRGASDVSSWLHAPMQLVLYLLQTAVTLAAVAWLVSSLWSIAARTPRGVRLRSVRPWPRRLLLLAVTLTIATTPMVTHYTESIMRDSLSASCLLLAVVAAIRVGVLRDVRVHTVLIGLLAATAAELNRIEKIGEVVPVVVLVLVGLLVLRRRTAGDAPGAGTRRIAGAAVALVALAVVPTATVLALDRHTQTARYGRAVRDDSLELRDLFVLHPYTPRILGEYLASPAAASVNHWSNAEDATGWDESRMVMAHPGLSRIYLDTSAAVLGFAVVLLVGYAALRMRMRVRPDMRIAVAVAALLLVVVLNSVLFTNYGPSFNVRYALPGYFIDEALLVWACALVLQRLHSLD